MFGHQLRANIYFALAAVGLITAWVLNGIASFEGADYINAWFGSIVDWVLSVDLLIVAAATVVFMLYEAKKLGMKRVWLYFLLSGVTALAFTFPLFLAFRELRNKRSLLPEARSTSSQSMSTRWKFGFQKKFFPIRRC